MEFRCRTANQPPPPPQHREQLPPQPPLSGYGYSTEQSIRAGYRKPGFGLGNDYSGQGIGHTVEYFRPGTGWGNEYFRIPSDVRAEIQRSLEKERIRDEIIAAEIARRLVLEAEVRAEMRMERELALRRGDPLNRFLFPLGAGMALDSRGITLQQEAKGLVERIAMYAEERLRMGKRCETLGFDTLPFQQRSVEPVAKGVTPSHSQNSKQKEKIVFLAKPTSSLSGAKRKDVSPAEESRKSEVKDEWNCVICQVSTNSERVLKDHFQGKKHKSKEAALRAKMNGCNIGIGVLLPKNAVNTIIGDTHVLSSPPVGEEALHINENVLSPPQGLKLGVEVLQINQSEPSSLHTVSTKCLDENSRLILPENEKKDKLKNKKLVGVRAAPNSKLKEKEKFTFWCDMCQVGTYCEIAMEDHRKGKKHLKLLKNARENGQANLTSCIVDIQGANGSDETPKGGDNKASENVDRTATKVQNNYVKGN